LTTPGNANSRAAGAMMQEFECSGVTDACVSPGSRSTPLVTALLRGSIRPWVVLEERSGGFFAMGLARETRRPVILVCTSGTAAANYAPAVAEASLSRIPLIVLTADRPPEARDCRAAQTIDQVRMFGSHARWSVDVAAPSDGTDLDDYYRTLACRAVSVALGPPAGPVHLNLPMREPLIDVAEEAEALRAPARRVESSRPYVRVAPARTRLEPAAIRAIAREIRERPRGVIVCGPGVEPQSASAIAALAERLGWPILADPLSGLRFGGHDRRLVVDAYDVLLRDPGFVERNQPDAVLQFGDPPVSKALGQFLSYRRRDCHVIVAEPGTWPDPFYLATEFARSDAPGFCASIVEELGRNQPASSHWSESWIAVSRAIRNALDRMLAAETTMFEGKVVTELLRLLPEGSLLQVGNSMPVRDLDTFAGHCGRALEVRCNRGANGIDGVLSTAMGAAAARRAPTALVLGDLSFLHDLPALHIAARHPIDLLAVVINNDGGGIFSFLPQASLGADAFETFFGTPHGLNFERAAALGSAHYARADSWESFNCAVEAALARRGFNVIEIPGNRAQNLKAHRQAIAKALDCLREYQPPGGCA
jgi:2-succinyl-5-enolpyruvyl-6-hydroxy-3-cyclohexene-1-carboxylate synthase